MLSGLPWVRNENRTLLWVRNENRTLLRTAGFSVRLVLMRWRTSYIWALGAFVALAVLAFDGRPSDVVGSAGAVSAPFAPRASVESGPAGQVLLSHFYGCGHALRSSDL